MLYGAAAIVSTLSIVASQGSTSIAGFLGAGITLLAIALWFALWLLRPHSLPPHFNYRRMRLRGQLRLLLKFRRWVGTLSSTAGVGAPVRTA